MSTEKRESGVRGRSLIMKIGGDGPRITTKNMTANPG